MQAAVQNPYLFALVFATITTDAELTQTEQGVMLAVTMFIQKPADSCYPALETLASLAKCSKTSVQRALASLEAMGLLSKTHRGSVKGQAKRLSNAYALGPMLVFGNQADPNVGIEAEDGGVVVTGTTTDLALPRANEGVVVTPTTRGSGHSDHGSMYKSILEETTDPNKEDNIHPENTQALSSVVPTTTTPTGHSDHYPRARITVDAKESNSAAQLLRLCG